MARGVFAIDRELWDDPEFPDEPFTQREAWIWLVGNAAWRETRTRGNAGPVTLQRGEFSYAVRYLATRWGWTKDRVQRFLTALKKRDTIRDANRDGSQVYSIKNYNRFQVVGLPKRDSDETQNDTEARRERDASATAARQDRDKEETIKQLNIETGKQVVDLSSLGRALTAAIAAIARGAEFIRLPTNRFESNREEVPFFENQVRQFEGLYPAVDVRAHLRAMKGWLLSNPKKRKTASGMNRFVNSWLSDKQDKAGANGSTLFNGQHRNGGDTSNLIEGTRRAIDRAREEENAGSDHT